MARPKIQIDQELVSKLAGIGCTDLEISTLVGCSVDTLSRRFAEVLHKGRQDVRMRLRRAQLKLAESGNAVMLIWLGKQYLGQVDRQEIDATVKHQQFEVEIGGTSTVNTDEAFIN